MKTINNSRRWIIPLVTGIVCLLSFGLLIPWLGFYWDDWPIITAARLQGVNAFWDYYRFERPISAWMAIATTPLLGDRAWGWHLSNLAVRWLTVLGVWWGLSGLWPQRACQISWVTLLFAIYPVFTQQPVAATFIQHWICFALYSFSLGAMIYAIRCPRWFWPLSLLAYLATLVHTLSLEYFWGLELLRPLILWLVMDNDKDARHRLRRTLQMWAPYFLILVGVVTWRMFFIPIVRTDPNRPELLIDLASQPLGTLLRLAQISMQDLLYNLWGAWYETFKPAQIDLADRAVLASWVVAVLTTGLCMYVFFYLERNDT